MHHKFQAYLGMILHTTCNSSTDRPTDHYSEDRSVLPSATSTSRGELPSPTSISLCWLRSHLAYLTYLACHCPSQHLPLLQLPPLPSQILHRSDFTPFEQHQSQVCRNSLILCKYLFMLFYSNSFHCYYHELEAFVFFVFEVVVQLEEDL